ncbi:MAG: hypothetical protein EA381_20505 [Planctomycetaceae bacterium]|nr:MAG: hypothetical protein EA381_20505 [Planctomycetaceae bacterium]
MSRRPSEAVLRSAHDIRPGILERSVRYRFACAATLCGFDFGRFDGRWGRRPGNADLQDARRIKDPAR